MAGLVGAVAPGQAGVSGALKQASRGAAARPPRLVQSMSTVPIPPILTTLIGHIAAAVPRRARITFTELLIGAAATRGGHVADAILAAGLSRSWTTYYWLLQRGRWTWLAVWQALLSPDFPDGLVAPECLRRSRLSVQGLAKIEPENV